MQFIHALFARVTKIFIEKRFKGPVRVEAMRDSCGLWVKSARTDQLVCGTVLFASSLVASNPSN